MRRTFFVSFFASFVMLGFAVVGASLHHLPPTTDSAQGSTGHTKLTETAGTGCVNCHNGAGVTVAFTTTNDVPVTTTQLYPGEGAAFHIKAVATGTFAGGPHNWMGANIATTTAGGKLIENELALVITNGEIQHTSTAGYLLNTVPAGGSNFYTFFYQLTSTAIPATNTIAGVACVGFPGSGQHAASIVVTSRRPADPASLVAGAANSNSIPLSWSSSSPLNRLIAKTGAFATSPTDTTGTIVYEGGNTSQTITGLSPVTTYFFKVFGESSYSGIDTFSTNGATTTAATTSVGPPPAASGLTVTNLTGTGADVSWRGTSPEFRAIYKAASVPTSPTDGTLITPEGATTSATLSGLLPNTRYFIAVYGRDPAAATTYSPSAATTSLITGPTQLVASDGLGGGSTPWDRRGSPTRLGKFIYTNGADLQLYDGSAVSTLQPKGTLSGNPSTVFEMGTATDPTKVMAAWRRDAAYVWTEGGSTQTITATNPVQPGVALNAEVITIDGGCVFVTFRATNGATDIRNAFKVDPVTGIGTNLTNNSTKYGVVHMSSGGCSSAAWAFDTGTAGNGPTELQYYNGTSVSTIAPGIVGDPSVAKGRVVYAKDVGGNRAEIFLYDPNVSPTPVQLTSDATKTNETPFTDGRHVAWVRRNNDGTGPEIMLNGNVQVTSGNFSQLDNAAAPPFDLDRGQILWRDTTGKLHHLTSASNDIVDPSTAANTAIPWLADGRVLFFDSSVNPATIYLYNGRLPVDAQQPSAPMTLSATAGSTSVLLKWDAILPLSTTYNVYYSTRPGVTKANYASLGGTRITGITQPQYNVTGLAPNSPYYLVVTATDTTGEGPESRQASVVLFGTPTWTSVGGLAGTNMSAVAADRTVANNAYASGGNDPFNTYASTDGGATWTPLSGGIGGVDVRALAASSGTVFATSRAGSIYRTTNGGTAWSGVAAGTSGKFQQAVAIDPAIPTTIVAGDFELPSFGGTLYDSDMIRSDDNGATWFHIPQLDPSGSLVAYSLAFDPNRSSILYVGGNGTPNVAKSLAGGAGWTSATPAAGSGYVFTVAIDPQNSQTLYAGTTQAFGAFFPGVWKSTDGGATWNQLTTGLPASTPVHAIIVDPADSNLIHLGTESGYYDSTNAGASWTSLNGGLTVGAQYMSALAMTGFHRLIAATGDGLYVLNLSAGPAPAVTSVSPNSGNVAGGTSVVMTGSNFVSGATVTFGGVAATNAVFGNSTTITATTPAHAAGAVDVVVRNPDGQTGTLTGGFTYNTTLVAPTNLVATAATGTQVNLTWAVVSGATSYRVYRRATVAASFALIGSPATNAYPDTGVTANHSYQYVVQAVNATISSVNSTPDVATTILFTDDPLLAGTTVIKAVHLSELRAAVDAMRVLANLGAGSYTGGAAGTVATAAQINELRTALDPALTALGLASGGYTDTVVSGVVIKAVHFQEIRNRVK